MEDGDVPDETLDVLADRDAVREDLDGLAEIADGRGESAADLRTAMVVAGRLPSTARRG